MTRLVIDPVTRVNGHLRIEVDVVDGVVRDAWTSGQMFRGVEGIIEGRDPRDAWLVAQRICGTCGTAHALASVRAVERALGVAVPPNARLIRNLMTGAKIVVDHAANFYLRHVLDWVDVTSALRADPAAASALARSSSDRAQAEAPYLKSAQERLSALLAAGLHGPLANGYWRHPAYTLPPEPSLMILAHYLEATDWQREMTKLQVTLGGKSPHPQTFLVGGMAVAPPWGGPRRPDPGQHPWRSNRDAPSPLGPPSLEVVGSLIDAAQAFVTDVYLPDVLTLASHYGEWSDNGRGIGHYLSFGAFPQDGTDDPALLLPRGRIMDRNLGHVVEVGQAGVAESVAHAHYVDDDGGALRHPSEATTQPRYAGPKPPFTTIEGQDRYSWLKAPRYEDDPMEVGPLARVLVAYASGTADVTTTLDRVASRLHLRPDQLGSTLGRTVARAVESQVVADRLDGWLGELRSNLASGDLALADITRWDSATWPREAAGWSIGESASGAVGHWLRIEDRRIASYQVVDATTWNASPRDRRGRRGAVEEALVGTPVADPARPVEILRTVRSFDPCMACAAH